MHHARQCRDIANGHDVNYIGASGQVGGVYPGTVGIPGMWLGSLSSRPFLRFRKCSRGWTCMPRVAARWASEAGDSWAATWAWSVCCR